MSKRPRSIGKYSNEDLRAVWGWVDGDFEKFLEFMNWMETLKEPERREQLDSAIWLATQNFKKEAR